MSGEENKALVRRFVHDVFEQLDAAAVDQLVTDDFISHTWSATGAAKEFLKQATKRIGEGLTDTGFVVEDLIAEDDRVAARLTARGTALGDFHGVHAQGRSYAIGEIHIFRVRDGKICEHWHQFDGLGMIRQLRGEA